MLEKQYKLITDNDDNINDIIEYYKYLYTMAQGKKKEELLEIIEGLEKEKSS